MPKGVPNKRYTPEFKKLVVETMQKEKLSYSETARRFEVSSDTRVRDWERIYRTEGPEGFSIERRGCGSKGRPPKQRSKEVEEDLLTEVQRLRAENAVMENFFGLLKSKLLYLQEFSSMEHFRQEWIEYLDYYNNHRIKAKIKGLPPAIHRQQALSVI